MDPDTSASGDALEDFCLREASRLYTVELSTLQSLVRRRRIDAYKASGPWGREWRVTRLALEASGYRPRPVPDPAAGTDERVARLERELRAARRTAAAERSRAQEADRRLGEALMESGRLRAAAARAEADGEQDVVSTVDMEDLRGVVLHLRAGRRTGEGF